MPQTDTIKLIATYGLAAMIFVLGYLALRDPASPESTSLLWAGLMTLAAGFVFNDAANTRGQRSFQAGLYTPSPPGPTNGQAEMPPPAADPPKA